MPNHRRPIRLHRGWRQLQQFACALLAICCVSSPAAIPALAQEDADLRPVTVTATALRSDDRPCQDAFVAQDLPHQTAIAGNVVRMFDANGAGVAAGDLDNDGDLDLLLGNQDGDDTLLWNEGALTFRAEPFPPARRAT